jgi:hypothetical protein
MEAPLICYDNKALMDGAKAMRLTNVMVPVNSYIALGHTDFMLPAVRRALSQSVCAVTVWMTFMSCLPQSFMLAHIISLSCSISRFSGSSLLISFHGRHYATPHSL